MQCPAGLGVNFDAPMPDGLSLAAILLYVTARWIYTYWMEDEPSTGGST